MARLILRSRSTSINLALVFLDQQSYEKAEQAEKQALDIVRQRFGDAHPALAAFYHTLGMIALERKRLDEAETLLSQALKLRLTAGDDLDRALSYSSLGWVLFDRARWAEAYDNFDHATTILSAHAAREARVDYSPSDVNGQADIMQARSALLGFLAAAYKLSEVQPGRRSELADASFKVAQFASVSQAGNAIAQMAARYAGQDDALHGLIRDRENLVVRWRVTVQASDANRPNENGAIGKLEAIDKQIHSIDDQLKDHFEKYVLLANPEPVSLDQVRAQLRGDEAFVLTFDLPDIPSIAPQTLVWVATRDGSPLWYSAPLGTRGLAYRAEALRCGLDASSWRSGKEDPARPARCAAALGADAAPQWNGDGDLVKPPGFDLARAHELYELLFSPADQAIHNKRLLVVPSGPLAVLPLHILVTAAPDIAIPTNPNAYAKASWLGTRNAITVLPTAAPHAVTSFMGMPDLHVRMEARQAAAPKYFERKLSRELLVDPAALLKTAGLVERVTFHNAENGFCVLRAKARGHRDLVTVVGHAAIISAGEWITASGEWINDRAHGQQFKARFLKTSAPSSIDGIEKYLGSGMIRGIGPVYAKKMGGLGRKPGRVAGESVRYVSYQCTC